MTRLRLTEMFFSLQGEARTVGWPTVFIRLTGCPLRCGYCDSEYAFYGGEYHELEAILAKVAEWSPRYVCVTGGEPLAQKGCIDLLKALCDAGYGVSLETSGALDISEVDTRVSRVVDIKTPGSGEVDKNRWANLPLLTANDQIKFVLCDRKDYDWARMKLDEHRLTQTCDVLFSPVFGRLSYRDLAEWILADRLPVRMQVQLHKHIWGDVPGH
ncbi:7-carboxy-7-deazaguanine synthase QueE [Permianibacter sp. IMCC34836]|uniref:7-carboxy-7-deazaguanine synthase QueE n=1 Tax=Permianibacter fluminis TaxID=2738515 RepID=UPI001552FCD2|nr:7-carboxy-7-deazaguanine synthase QueE [Permianibacter fluminis]NQD38624.1 7-carboxy-7-deazaguanine synthase QueE [Permianibacter fluminis]